MSIKTLWSHWELPTEHMNELHYSKFSFLALWDWWYCVSCNSDARNYISWQACFRQSFLLPSRRQLSHLGVCSWIVLRFFFWYHVYHATSLVFQQDSHISKKVLHGIGNMLPWVHKSFNCYLCHCQINGLFLFWFLCSRFDVWLLSNCPEVDTEMTAF